MASLVVRSLRRGRDYRRWGLWFHFRLRSRAGQKQQDASPCTISPLSSIVLTNRAVKYEAKGLVNLRMQETRNKTCALRLRWADHLWFAELNFSSLDATKQEHQREVRDNHLSVAYSIHCHLWWHCLVLRASRTPRHPPIPQCSSHEQHPQERRKRHTSLYCNAELDAR